MNEIDPIEYGRLIQSVERLTRDVQVLRLVTFGRSLPGETISAAAWSLEGDGKWQWQRHLYKKEQSW